MKQQHVLVTGGANLDLTGTSHSTLRAADSNPGHVKSAAGGVGRNIAENLARLGNRVGLVTLLGDDVGRKVITDSCQAVGIDLSCALVDPGKSTGTYLAVNDQHGELALAINDMGIIDSLLPDILATRQEIYAQADALVIEANLPAASIEWISQHFNHKCIHADAVSGPKARRLLPALSHLETLKVNCEESAILLGKTGEAEVLAEGLRQQGVRNVLLSLGNDGALLHCDQGVFYQPPFTATLVSQNGAGDALLAGFLTGQHLFEAPQKQLAFAIGCASLTLESISAVHPTLSIAKVNQQFLSD